MATHEQSLAEAFDGQAAQFERAWMQTNLARIERLVRFADLPPDSSLLDSGCGPGLVAAGFLAAGHRVSGVDLSAEMIARAHRRCESFGNRARFEQRSLFDPSLKGPFDAVVSRLVLHHTPDPAAFVRRQVELLRPGGILVLSDHTTDPDPAAAQWHQDVECARDRTHTRNATPGELIDLLAASGLVDLRLSEEAFTLDFDEWFDRGTPAEDKEVVRKRLLTGPGARGFRAEPLPSGAMQIHCWMALVRGVLPQS